MKTYGESRKAAAAGDWTTDRAGGWKGSQSRKIANKRSKASKALHKLGRLNQKRQMDLDIL
jgi:hypothetical protein